jgi:haloalkane dehalogenase
MTSYMWAMSLFGAQQMLNLFSPSRAADSFESVTSATEGELGNSLQSAFRAGDALQRGMIDLMFGGFLPGAGGGRGGGRDNGRDGGRGNGRDGGRGNGRGNGRGGSRGGGRGGGADAYRGADGYSPDGYSPGEYEPNAYSPRGGGQAGGETAQQSPASAPQPYTGAGGPGWGAIPVSGRAAPQPSGGRQQPHGGQQQGGQQQGGQQGGQQQGGQIPHESDISPDYPFAPHYVEVLGSRMHYVDEGRGDTIIFLHGNPTWSYLWRNVIPQLTPHARCIAPDLVGYGRSDKPDIEYRWAEQARYVEEFINKLNLKNVTLVLHDWGVSLGLNYALRHENNVRAVAFMEGIFKTFPAWEDFSTPEFRALFQRFRQGGEGGEGWQMLVEQNFFIEELLSGGVGRRLSGREQDFYREPFTETRSRVPIWRLARSVPVAGEPREVWDAVNDITERLKRSRMPKLLLYATPGGLVTSEYVEWCRRNLQNLKAVSVGPGLHYIQESSPRLIGRELADWYGGLRRGR